MIPLLLLSAAFMAIGVLGQSFAYNDSKTGITFQGYVDATTGFTFGLALPPKPDNDFIGQIITPLVNGTGWGGVSLNGVMVNRTLLAVWPDGKNIISSFRMARDYVSPSIFIPPGSPTMSAIKSGTFSNATHLSYTFLCSRCISSGNPLTFNASEEVAIIGYAVSNKAPMSPSSMSSNLAFHSAGYGLFGINIPDSKSPKYATWAAMASRNASRIVTTSTEQEQLSAATLNSFESL